VCGGLGPVFHPADRIVALLKDRSLASRLGEKAKESVRNRFQMTRLMEEWLDLMGSFEPRFGLRGAAGSQN
jgi:trehalose synthase